MSGSTVIAPNAPIVLGWWRRAAAVLGDVGLAVALVLAIPLVGVAVLALIDLAVRGAIDAVR